MMIAFLKSWLIPAFFICFFPSLYAQSSLNKNDLIALSQHTQWLRLLHVKNGRPRITDERFILSADDFSPYNELVKTYQYFKSDFSSAFCRFPARYQLLLKYTDIQKPNNFNGALCEGWLDYTSHVPFDALKLVFASEVLSSASSMMGHTLLQVSGENKNKNNVSHSVSFISEIKTYNPIKLIYDGVFSGMDGFFVVKPFDVDYTRYLEKEGRNLWFYHLSVNEFDRFLIQAHLWELKNIKIEYLFQSYNCATLTLNILGLVNNNIIKEEKLFVSPIDVIKAAKKWGMVNNSSVALSRNWEMKMLGDQTPSKFKRKINKAIKRNEVFSFNGLSLKEKLIAKKYTQLILDTSLSKKEITKKYYDSLKPLLQKNNTINVDVSNYKNPLKTRQDSSLSLSISEFKNNQFLNLGFMPAARQLYSDNRQFFSESELTISEITLQVNTSTLNVKVDEYTLYGAKSFTPSDSISPSLSGEFFLGYRRRPNALLDRQGLFEMSASFGKTYRLHNDVMVYGLLGGGVGASQDNAFLMLEPKIGSIIYTLGDTKVLLDHKISKGAFDLSGITATTGLHASWFHNKHSVLLLSLELLKYQGNTEKNMSFKFDYEF